MIAPTAGAAPAAGESLTERHQRELIEAVRARGLDPESILFPGLLSEEMRDWARQRVPEGPPPLVRLRTLLAELTSPDGLDLDYRAGRTGTAREVFDSGEANCLSFTQLFVSMAREVGLDAYFLEVERQPRFEKEGDLVVLWEHVTAGYGPPHERLLLEFGQGPPIRSASSRPLSDLTALAIFYSNRGAESLRDGRPAAALEWLQVSVTLDAEWSHGWLNLGVARRRLRDLDGAEAAYRRAIELEPEHYQAYANLATLLRLKGERDAAGELLRLLDRRDNRDPFIYLALGDASLEAGELGEARRFYRRALTLGLDRAEPRAAMGEWAAAAGRPQKAWTWLERAERVDPASSRVRRLRERLSGEPAEPDEELPLE